MHRSRFHVAAMDCPSEEQLIRTALGALEISRLEFDLPRREITVWHPGDITDIRARLEELDLGASFRETTEAPDGEAEVVDTRDQSGVLRLLLAINGVMFAVELIAGWLADSTGLLADSLDMLADAAVYGLALWAVGRAHGFQLTAARISGWLQLALGLGVLGEVTRRAISGSTPEPPTMLAIAALALAANMTCMLALARHRDGGVHMRASWIFTANDAIANVGVIVAGVLVGLTSSAIPDLVIGVIISLIVLRGAIRILKLGRS